MRSLAFALAFLLGLIVVVLPGSARATVTWSVPTAIDAAPPWNAGFDTVALSCPSSSLCAAVTAEGDVLTTTTPTGSAPAAWTVKTIDSDNELEGISCPSTAFCAAVDDVGNLFTNTNPTSSSSTWTMSNSAVPVGTGTALAIVCVSTSFCEVGGGTFGPSPESTAWATTDPGDASPAWTTTNVAGKEFAGISCASTALCVAALVGGDTAYSDDPAAATPTWTSSQTDGTNNVNAVSCATATNPVLCIAVDDHGNALTSTDGGQSWVSGQIDGAEEMSSVSCLPDGSACVAVDEDGYVVATADPGDGTSATWTKSSTQVATRGFGSVSCPSGSFCAAFDGEAGAYTSTDVTTGLASVPATAGTWTSHGIVDGYNFLDDVACPSASFCAAVDGGGNAFLSTNPRGGVAAWTKVSADGSNSLNAVACPSTSLCVAVDAVGNVITTTNGGTSWTVTSVDSGHALYDISCASTSICVAVDDAGNVFTSSNPGTHGWSLTTNVGGTLYTVACPSTVLCVAFDYDYGTGDAYLVSAQGSPTNAGSWAKTSINVFLGSISCPTTSFCAGEDGGAEIYSSTAPANASSWTETTVSEPVVAVSCPSASSCIAAANSGDVLVSADPTGGTSAWTATAVDGNGDFDQVGCSPDGSICVAVDDSGNVVAGAIQQNTGGGTTTSSSGGSGGGGSSATTTTTTTSPSTPTNSSVLTGSVSYGSGKASSSSTTNVIDSEGKVTADVFVPAGALPAGTTVSVYPTSGMPAVSKMPSGQGYVVSFAVTWQAPDGSVPNASAAISLTITDPAIGAGDRIYEVTSSGLTADGKVTVNGEVTITFMNDPVFMIAAVPAVAFKPELVTRKSKHLLATLDCVSGSKCAGSLRVTLADRATKNGRTTTTHPTVATGRFTLSVGAQETVVLPLTRLGESLAASASPKHPLRASITTSLAGGRVSTATIKLA
ncbi:MAG TPA: hypothetical protein VGL76_07205 [Gaiellaceae bacterium]